MTYTPNYERIAKALNWGIDDDLTADDERKVAAKCDSLLYAKGASPNLNRVNGENNTEEWLYFALSDRRSIIHATAPTRELAILNVFEQFLEKEGK